jgi:hypothetical protein
MKEARFRTIEPKILYFGTPVALISSLNEDGSTNLAPMSSFWALGWTLMLGLLDETKTAENLGRHPECVANLPAPDLWRKVEEHRMNDAIKREVVAVFRGVVQKVIISFPASAESYLPLVGWFTGTTAQSDFS